MLSPSAFVTSKSKSKPFLLHLARGIYFVTYLELSNKGAHINSVLIFKFKQTS